MSHVGVRHVVVAEVEAGELRLDACVLLVAAQLRIDRAVGEGLVEGGVRTPPMGLCTALRVAEVVRLTPQ